MSNCVCASASTARPWLCPGTADTLAALAPATGCQQLPKAALPMMQAEALVSGFELQVHSRHRNGSHSVTQHLPHLGNGSGTKNLTPIPPLPSFFLPDHPKMRWLTTTMNHIVIIFSLLFKERFLKKNVSPNTLHFCAQQTDIPATPVGTWSSSEVELQDTEAGQTWYRVCRVMGKRRCKQTIPVYHHI